MYKSYKLLFQLDIEVQATVFYKGIYNKNWDSAGPWCIGRLLQTDFWKHVETQLFYPKISQLSCHAQHSTYNRKVAI